MRKTYPFTRGTSYKMLASMLVMMSFGIMSYAQITTSSMVGRVLDETGEPLIGANVVAVHGPSGTTYGTSTNENGRYTIPAMRVGGPYMVTVSYTGFAEQKREDVFLSLGTAATLDFRLQPAAFELMGVTVTADRSDVFSASRTGAATSVSREALATMPTISRRINDFTRLTPQSAGSRFGGIDDRLNNITVDGSYFNNSFGLAGQPGDRTGVSPISLDAIEQIQVNIAPFDVRQGNFIGAGVNTVTKSGTNDYSGSAYYLTRHANIVGTRTGDLGFNPGDFSFNQFGATLGGAIKKNKLFFFASYENDELTQPGTTFRANTGGQTVSGNTTRVLASDLDALSNFLRSNFGYETGPYQDYDNVTASEKFLIKLDYNLNQNNNFSIRYNHLNSDTDVLLSNSSSLGFGNRRTNLTGLNFRNSNYKILENIRSIVGEWNSMLSNSMSNNLIVGYTFQDESRASLGNVFPMVDILEEGSVYTTFGFEPFTPNNELRYKSFQLQNNFSIYRTNHTYTIGLSLERYESENVFFPGSQSAYVYNSLADFYTDANDFLANPGRTTSPVALNRFQVRWSNVPGQEKPVQPLEVFYAGVYAQDVWNATDRLNLTLGLRIDVPFFGNTALRNADVEELAFRDQNGGEVRFQTDKLPDANPLFSPRIGFNFDVDGDRRTQLRGGTGIFTSRPAYVWISNQIGANGILTGFERLDNTTARPFNPNPDTYKPSEVTGAPASQYELAFTQPDFKFPQVWRSNVAVDQKLPLGFIGTLEFMYSRDVNGLYYYNANLRESNGQFSGVDDRARWVGGNRIHSHIDNAVTLTNQSEGSSWNFAASVEKPFVKDFFFKAGYSYGETKNAVDPGSIAFGSWNNNQHMGDPNNPGIGFSSNMLGHRVFGGLTYRAFYSDEKGATTISLFFDGFNQGVGSYVFSGDLNGDGGTANDLIYIHANRNEMNFQEYTAGGRTFTVEQQRDAWEAFINQDKYLSANRGKYAERGGVLLPMVYRLDLSVMHDFYFKVAGKRNSIQLRMDIFNFTNMLNKEWGQGQSLTTTTPLVVPTGAQGGPVDAEGRAQYRLQNIGGQLITSSYRANSTLSDVYRIQFGIRYTWN